MSGCCVITGSPLFPGEALGKLLSEPRSAGSFCAGEVRFCPDVRALPGFLPNLQGRELCVLMLWDPGLDGAAVSTLLRLCRDFSVRQLLLLGSVRAIPAGAPCQLLQWPPEQEAIRAPAYRTLEMAVRTVLEAGSEAMVTSAALVSNLLGPGTEESCVAALLSAHMQGRLRFCPEGSCDFADIRDVAAGLRTILEDRIPDCWLLTGNRYSLREVLAMVRPLRSGQPYFLPPRWCLKGTGPVREAGELVLWEAGHRCSHDPAASRLGYCVRDLRLTVRDMIPGLLQRQEMSKKA